MLLVPNSVFNNYLAHLKKRGLPVEIFAEYKKWLRYYLDFCDKYPVPDNKSERVRMFTDKLSEKKAGQLRHPGDPEAPGAREPEDDDDLHPLRAGQDGERAEKPARFLE